MSQSSSLRFIASLAVALLFTGCAMQTPSISSTAEASTSFSGSVHGGQQPVSGSTIQLYAAGSSTGGAATPLLTTTVTTSASGGFNITNDYSCPTGAYVYITSTGGNPGLASTNPNLALMAALGPCSSLTSSTDIQLNELTTVAAVSALAPYMTSFSAVGSPDTTGLAAAFTLAAQLVNFSAGSAPGTSVPSGASVPTATINTLGDIIASCVNSTGGVAADGSACGQLFADTTRGALTPPTNTIAALLNLANDPTLNPTQLFGLLTSTPPFSGTLAAAPASFAIALSWQTTALQISPASLTFPTTSVNSTSATQVVTIQNTSSAPVSINPINLAGINAGEFNLSNNTCPASLAAGNSCTLKVSITPTAVGAQFGNLVIQSSAAQSPQTVQLSGTNPVPTINGTSPGSIYAGSGQTTTVYVTVTNALPSTLIQVNGTDRTTTYLSSSQVSFQLTAADTAAAGQLTITAVNPPTGGGTSSTFTFTVSPALTQLSTSGKNIVNASGATVQLNGINLGGWFIMENYMTPIDSAGAYTDMYSLLTELDTRFGVATEQSLVKTYQTSWITAQDLNNMQAEGFNEVRIPIWWGMFFPLSSQTTSSFRSDSFTVLDAIINQCAARGIYVILDMHGALGSQNGSEDTGHTNDGGSSTGSYFGSSYDQSMTVWLWEQIASHYSAANFANSAAIAGYDLLNEPSGGSTTQVIAQYNSLYAGIRGVDPTRMIIMETISSASYNWNTLPAPSVNSWSDVVYSTHMYACTSTPTTCTASQVATLTSSTVSSWASTGYNIPAYVGEYTAYNTGVTQWESTQTAFTNAGLSSSAWTYKSDTTGSYTFWGGYIPGASQPPVPNITTSSSSTIASDWSSWTTPSYFVVNTLVHQ